jgi:hypothetical protein
MRTEVQMYWTESSSPGLQTLGWVTRCLTVFLPFEQPTNKAMQWCLLQRKSITHSPTFFFFFSTARYRKFAFSTSQFHKFYILIPSFNESINIYFSLWLVFPNLLRQSILPFYWRGLSTYFDYLWYIYLQYRCAILPSRLRCVFYLMWYIILLSVRIVSQLSKCCSILPVTRPMFRYHTSGLLHATKALGRRGSIAPTHSRPRH